MLPSTGYFKAINCPFYESGSCDRPYCHFKHLRKEDVATTSTSAEAVAEAQNTENAQSGKATVVTNPEMLQQLVEEAVKNVLANQEVGDKEKVSQTIVSQVVQGLKPNLELKAPMGIQQPEAPVPIMARHINIPQQIMKPVVYNPTPIAELKKRHIPVYMPTRDRIAVKRKALPEDKPWSSAIFNSEVTYKPTAINSSEETAKSYVPTVKASIPENPYDDGNKKEIYYPKTKKKREEYIPKMVKTPLKVTEEVTYIPSVSKVDDNLSNDTPMEVEPKFSDDECEIVEEEKTDRCSATTSIPELNNIKESQIEVDKEDRKSSSKSKSSRRESSDTSSVDKSRDKREHGKSRSHEKSDKNGKRKHDDKSIDDKTKNRHKSSTSSSSNSHKGHDKDKKENSRSKDRHSSRTHKDEDKEHKSKSSSKSHRDKDSRESKKSDKDRHKSDTKHDKSRSKSSSKSDKNSSSRRNSDERNSANEKHKKSDDDKSTKKNSESESDERIAYDDFATPVVDEVSFTSDEDEHDVDEECRKIFEEYQVTDHKSVVSIKEPMQKVEEPEESKSKRVAHPSAEKITRDVPEPKKKIKRPVEVMLERLQKIAAMRPTTTTTPSPLSSSSSSLSERRNSSETKSFSQSSMHNGNGKIRIAQAPYALSMALAKKKMNEKLQSPPPVEVKTVAQTARTGHRVAHVPLKMPQITRPQPLQLASQKFPLNVRQLNVNNMQDICIQIYTSSEDAAQRALKEELICHDKCKSLVVYKNSCMLALHRLRKEVEQGSSMEQSAPSGMISHEAMLAGKSKGSWSVVKNKKFTGEIKGPVFYSMLVKWIVTEKQLQENGFPRPHPDGPKGRAKVYVHSNRGQSQLSKVPNERHCCRCSQAYMVDKRGMPVRQQNCIYHWGRKFTFRGESKYSCCKQYGSATGCCDAKTHVWDHIDYDNLRGFVATLEKPEVPDEEQGVFALDCEMCYTTQGLELTRVTVIDEDCSVVYETLVKPINPILDYNTRFSGITEENMRNVTTTLLDVQATFLSMFSSKTILVGHSLESDFKALKLFHGTVVDTSVMFPHKNGLPAKRALRNLCSEYLRKIIQNDVGGHDSNEDAVSCMQLIQWKVKEEAKLL